MRWREFWVWRRDALTRSGGRISSRCDLIRGNVGVDKRCLRAVKTVTSFVYGQDAPFHFCSSSEDTGDSTFLAGTYMTARILVNRLTFVHRRHCRGWGQRHRLYDLRHWWHCIFSYESSFSVVFNSSAGERWSIPAFSQLMKVAAHQSWSGV